MIFRTASVVLFSLWLAAHAARSEESPGPPDLAASFQHPPPSARPWVYWFWMDGNVTREGITADLEAIQRVGLGGVLLMDVSQGLPRGPVQFNSPEWRTLFRHAVHEADRLGLELSLHNSAGWSGSGGPWIPPELAMRRLTSVATNLVGPGLFNGKLPGFPPASSNLSPVATLAFPSPTGDGGPAPGFPPERVLVSGKELPDASKLFDHDLTTFVSVPATSGRGREYLQLEFPDGFAAASLRLVGAGRPQSFRATLQVSDDGRSFHDLREGLSRDNGLSLVFEQTRARFFRLLFSSASAGLKTLDFSELELEPSYRIPWYQSKTGAGPLPVASSSLPPMPIPDSAAIRPEHVRDLSSQITADGSLKWQVPNGVWTVLQIASAPTGTKTRGVWPESGGFESDKLSRDSLKVHFDRFIGSLAAEAGKGRAFKATHIDSWEIGFQNWTPGMVGEFEKRRGYNPLPYFPALTGRYVGGAEQSERFLRDIRRTIADLVADNYGGYMAELAHQHGLQLSIEGYASLGKGPFDELQYGGRADVPMAEFWFGTNDLRQFQLRSMPSAAHTYGKQIVPAEAFTSEAAYSRWLEHPALLKPLADAAFCEGVNRLVIHRFAHQPWLNREPGMTMGPFGLHYERTQTWWELSRPWHEYLARCQTLLQQGIVVADVCYLAPEVPFAALPAKDQLNPPPPDGYNYDLANAEVVLSRMSVHAGRLMLPDGMSYRLLVLPTGSSMTPQLLTRIKELVAAGATVIGARPTNSPSLAGYPQCDAQVQSIAAELWGPCDGQKVTQNRSGQGRVFWGTPLHDIFAEENLAPDFRASPLPGLNPLRWIHRKLGTRDVYFVANPNPSSIDADCQFRVSGKTPGLWHPDTGQNEIAGIWHEQDGVTHVRLNLEASGSVFIVFQNSSQKMDPVTELRRDGNLDGTAVVTVNGRDSRSLLASHAGIYSARLASGKLLQTRVPQLPDPIPVTGPWQLTVPAKPGEPVHLSFDLLRSWTTQTNPMVKFFSGTATYETSFSLQKELLQVDREFRLNLGDVRVIAELRVNGVNLGILWRAPFEADVTRALQPGLNRLQVKITNLWPNRLIGDEFFPEDCTWDLARQSDDGCPILAWPDWLLRGNPSPTGRTTFTTWKHWRRNSPLLESGLLGPVTLRVLEHAPLH